MTLFRIPSHRGLGRLRPALWPVCVAVLLSACASPAIDEASRLGREGQHEAAVVRLQSALDDAPDDRALRSALFKQGEVAVADLGQRAQTALSSGRHTEAQVLIRRLEDVAPQHPRTAALRAQFDRILRLARLMTDAERAMDARQYERAEAALRSLLSEDPGHRRAQELLDRIEELRAAQTRQQTTTQLATAQKTVTLEFRDTPLKAVFETFARAADVNFVFDKDVKGDARVTLFLRGTTVEEAMRVILNTQQLGSKMLNANTVLVFPATQQKQRELLDTVTRSFYLTNTDIKQAQALVRTVAKSRDVFIDERLNLMVVRDTPEVIRLIERLVQGLDLPDPEVMLDMEVLEVTTKKLDQIGVNWPESVSYGLPGGGGVITRDSPLRFFTANPLAIANLKSTRGGTNLLGNPKVRARNREKAKVLLGEKLPIFTTTSTANVGVSASVSYLDVGLKLEVEPQVQLDNDVTIKVALEVSSVTDKVIGPQGSIAYQVGTRQASTTLRLKDGETQILAGLINDNESRSAAGLPGLSQLPLVGRLFGNITDSHDKTEVVLLVTPHIVRNLVQPAGALSPMPSGTDAQPGASPMILREQASASGSGGERMGAAAGLVARQSASSRAGAAINSRLPGVSGPEEVLPGASFQVQVRNPTTQEVSTTLQFDASVFEADNAPGGVLSLTVPPRGNRSVMLRVKAGVKQAETSIRLDAGGDPWPLRVRDPSDASAPGGSGAQPEEEDRGPDPLSQP